MTLLLSIDAGTTSVKAGVFTPNGECLAVERYEYQLENPAPEYTELDPEIYWQACLHVIRQALERPRLDPVQIAAITVSSQGETLITLDRHGAPLHPAIVWLDNRALQESRWLEEQIGSSCYHFTGIPDVSPTWTACKILWLKNNSPTIYSRVNKFLLVQDWLVYRLTGQYVTDGSISCTSLLYDINANRWWSHILEILELPESRLCEINQPGAVVGLLSDQAAMQSGLAAGTPVVLGGMDQAVGAIGAGNIRPGIISETTGGALVMQISIPRPDLDPNRRIPVNLHSVPGLYLFEPVCPTAGMALKWFRDVFGGAEIEAAKSQGIDVYDLLTSLAATIPPGAEGLLMLPHLSGVLTPTYNSEARGVFCGFTLAHQKGHFVRAILEAVAFILRRNLDVAIASGINASEIRTSGGGARSALWNQIKADVCGIPVISLATEEAALLGDAILGGTAVKIFDSLEDGVHRMVALSGRTEPSLNQDLYNDIYARYCDLDDTLDPFFRR
jgi:sugar (pentulose or hexulose) kinase